MIMAVIDKGHAGIPKALLQLSESSIRQEPQSLQLAQGLVETEGLAKHTKMAAKVPEPPAERTPGMTKPEQL